MDQPKQPEPKKPMSYSSAAAQGKTQKPAAPVAQAAQAPAQVQPSPQPHVPVNGFNADEVRQNLNAKWNHYQDKIKGPPGHEKIQVVSSKNPDGAAPKFDFLAELEKAKRDQ